MGRLALTLALSPRRGNIITTLRRKTLRLNVVFPTLTWLLPLLGERAGVRENAPLALNDAGLILIGNQTSKSKISTFSTMVMAMVLNRSCSGWTI
jgi:hypothetical protein